MSRDQKVKDRMMKIWNMACLLGAEMESLDDLVDRNSAAERKVLTCQGQFGDWRGVHLGEIMNLFGIPAEKRKVNVKKRGGCF